MKSAFFSSMLWCLDYFCGLCYTHIPPLQQLLVTKDVSWLLLALSVKKFRSDTNAAPFFLAVVNLCCCAERNRETPCLNMVVFYKPHHRLVNSVTLIYKWSMSNWGSLFIIFNYAERTSVSANRWWFSLLQTGRSKHLLCMQTNINAHGFCVPSERGDMADLL